ncbi:hypothetical protein D6851_05565 [Altericroceibacterium spongiae]|uniref:Uncharacterized protein n=1 Tax=Altericroceibacterium spongiae TaxID=2320269 RepID=A0A420EPS2_9SPHN|nr:hypothetical protein D6851_05565 [Altericroceibacterium spongiae]
MQEQARNQQTAVPLALRPVLYRTNHANHSQLLHFYDESRGKFFTDWAKIFGKAGECYPCFAKVSYE